MNKECDHVVGTVEAGGYERLFRLSQWEIDSDLVESFKHCPECGEAIEKQLND